ncbi:putative disease resistance protein At1g50180 [Fagus crenata]
MAESVVSGVVKRIGDLLIQEANFLSGVSDQVELLQTELKLMQGFLKDADARQEESETVRQWVSEIRELAYDADDIIGTYALTVASRRGGGIKKVLKRYACILDEGTTVHMVGSEIAKIKTKISNLTTGLQTYGIRASLIEGSGASALNERQREQRQTYSHLEHDVVGFDDDVNKLLDFLLKEEEGNRVASICGMGGLGKTTLAKMVYNHHEVKQHFNCRAWVFISQQCQRRNVWEGILFSLLSPSEKERKKIRDKKDEEIVDQLLQVLKEKKYLVILDDIWNTEHWDILCKAFPVKDTGSKILLTTRNRDVALHADPRGFLHNLQILNDQKSWELLEKIAISWREDSIIKTNMDWLGNEMLKYCGGLPLAITVLGGLLAAKHTQEEWEDVHRHVKSYLNVQEGLQFNKDKVLALSYNELPCHLKPCFLYLGHFPEDFEIPTTELVRMWMAEGFIQKIQHETGSKDTMEDVGERYLRELVQRCMVLVGKINSLGRIKTCRIHDLMRDFCVSKAQAENFLQITNICSMEESEAHIGKIRRLAINVELDDDYLKVKGIKFNEHSYLRSVLYFGQLNLPFKESRFKKFKLLRVLKLENFKNYHIKLPEDIGCLIHLRFLSLKYSRVNNVPSSMGNLRCLQTLDLRYRNHDVRVPNVFKKMEQLRHLYLPYKYRISEKLEVGNLCYLQTLVNVWPKKIRLPTSFTFNRLRVLKVGSIFSEADPDIIEKLNVRSYFEGSPEVHQFSSNLAKLTLEWTQLEEIPMATLEKLPNLKILRLLMYAFHGKNMVCSERGFPQLQSLVLSELCFLEEWRVEEGAMPSLCRLQIENCYELKTIPDGLRFVTTLQELEIKRMPKTFKDRVNKGGEDFCKVQHVPSLVFQHCD